MKGVFGKPWLDLSTLVPLHLLDEEAINVELALADKYNNLWGREHPDDPIHYLKAPAAASPVVEEFYKKHGHNHQALVNFSKLQYGVYSPTWVVRLTDMDKSLAGEVATRFQQNVDNPALWRQRRNGKFASVWRFIDECGVFETTGRITFFITDHHCHTPEHMDYDHPRSNYKVGHHAHAEKHFLWISLRGKSLYVVDEQTGTRHQINSRCMWFNSLDRHGADAVPQQTWSLRIDGVFSATFMRRLEETFGNGLSLLDW